MPDDGRVRPFSFDRQDAIERSRLLRFQPVLETMLQRFASTLGSELRRPLRCAVTGVEQITWEEHAASLPDPTYLLSTMVLPLESRLVMHVPVELGFTMLDVFLGGDGKSLPDRRTLTPIEDSLLEGLLQESLAVFPSAFRSFIELSLGPVQRFNSSIFVPTGRPEEMCLVVRVELELSGLEPGSVSLSLPLSALLPMIESFERIQRAESSEDEGTARVALERLLSVPVEVRVAFSPIELTPAELLAMQAGEAVIPLAQVPAGEEAQLEIFVADVPFGRGVLVDRKGKRLSCTVISRREEQP